MNVTRTSCIFKFSADTDEPAGLLMFLLCSFEYNGATRSTDTNDIRCLSVASDLLVTCASLTLTDASASAALQSFTAPQISSGGLRKPPTGK